MKPTSLLLGACRDFWEVYRLRYNEPDYDLTVELSVHGGSAPELHLTASPDGLLSLAGLLMKMALADDLSDLLHIDSAGIATEESVPLIVIRPYPPLATER